MRKNILIKVLISVFFLSLAIAALITSKQIEKKNAVSQDVGTITIEIVTLDNKVNKREFNYKEGDSVWSIIKENYIVRYSETQTGVWLYDIDDVKTDFTTTYLAIYVDDVYSNYTIDGIKIKDGLVVSLRETKL